MLRFCLIVLCIIPLVSHSRFPKPDNARPGIYIQTDRNSYMSGDTVWAKAYFNGMPVNDVGHASLWITDCTGKLISRAYKFKIQKRYSLVSIPLPQVSYTGVYYVYIHAPGVGELSFKKKIKIYGITHSKAECSESAFGIFVEGDKLIAGWDTRVVVKKYSNSLFSAGGVFNKTHETVAKFSFKSGRIGTFVFRAQWGNDYYIKFEGDPSGKKYPLGKVQQDGLFLKTESFENEIRYKIEGKPGTSHNDLFVVAHRADGKAVYQKSIDRDDSSAIGTIPVTKLSSGILRLALFDNDTTLLAERLCFINNKEYLLNSSFTQSLTSTEPHGENLYALNFDEAFMGTYSVSVTDANFDDSSMNCNIYSTVLLSNDLLYPVFYPPAFFEAPTDFTNRLIDMELIANKWQGKRWEDKLQWASGNPVNEIPGPGMLSGIVTVKGTDKLFVNQKINLISISEDSTSQTTTFYTNKDGRFRLDNIEWIGKNKLLFSPNDSKGKYAISVTLDSFLQQKQVIPQIDLSIEQFIGNNENTPFDSMLAAAEMLDNVTVRSNLNPSEKILIDRYATGVFKKRLGEVYDFTQYDAIRQPILSYLFPSYRNLRLNINSNGQRSMEARNIEGKYARAQLYIDELPVLGEIDQLDNLNVSDIAVIKVIQDYNVFSGDRSPSVLIYTRKGKDYLGSDANYGINFFEGFSKVFSFNNSRSLDALPQPDNRKVTIYWNNKAATSDRVQVIPIHFFNNNSARKFKVVVEGLGAGNKLFHFEKIIF